MRILRHQLPITAHQTLTLNGPILSVAQSRTAPNSRIDMWTLDHDTTPSTVDVWIVGTGSPMPAPLELGPYTRNTFIGTAVCSNRLVWHVFATKTTPAQENP